MAILSIPMPNSNDRLDRIEEAIERTQQQIEGLSQRIDSNAKAIEALTANTVRIR